MERRINDTETKSKDEAVGADEVAEIARDAAKNPDALEKLCDLYIDRIYGFILKRVGSVEDAEDITSLVFEKVTANLDTFDNKKASFTTWIYRIALNCVIDFSRSRGRRKEEPVEEMGESVGDVEVDFSDWVDSSVYLVQLMRNLPRKYEEALALRYFASMKVSEVAQVLGISETAASKRILRGLEKLRKLAEGKPISVELEGE
ncbi:MAG: RNA polymerase sigma factor [Actinomycetota bacterium]|nr:RNA polymerase sigma factor [Actinomycetota bacterium]